MLVCYVCDCGQNRMRKFCIQFHFGVNLHREQKGSRNVFLLPLEHLFELSEALKMEAQIMENRYNSRNILCRTRSVIVS